MIDAGEVNKQFIFFDLSLFQEYETVFTGGIVIAGNLVSPSHTAFGEQKHDIMAELTGPCKKYYFHYFSQLLACVDVHHNFVQRWNEAWFHDEKNGSWPSLKLANSLPFPLKISSPVVGNASVQVQRTIRANGYKNKHPAADSLPFSISDGEASIYEQVRLFFKIFIYFC